MLYGGSRRTLGYCALAALAVALMAVGFHMPQTDWGDLAKPVALLDAGRWSELFTVYTRTQDGPLMYLGLWGLHGVVGGLLRDVTLILGVVLLPAAVWLGEKVTGRSLVWPALLAVPVWVQTAVVLHTDDLLGVTLLLAAVLLRQQRRPVWCGLALALAVGIEPWTAMFAGLILADRRFTLRAGAVTVATVGAVWAPFVLANPATLHAASSPRLVTGLSTLTLFGWQQVSQTGVRLVQLAACVGATGWAARRDPALILAVGGAVRLLFDPQVYAYYGVALLVGAVLVDAGRRVPWTTLTAFGVWLVMLAQDGAVARVAFAGLLVAMLAQAWSRMTMVPRRSWVADRWAVRDVDAAPVSIR